MQLSPAKAQLSDPKMQLSKPIEDWELKYSHDVIVIRLEGAVCGNTLEKIEDLFYRCRYSYSFNRSNVAELFGVTENRAFEIAKVCVKSGIIIKQKNGVYTFASK